MIQILTVKEFLSSIEKDGYIYNYVTMFKYIFDLLKMKVRGLKCF